MVATNDSPSKSDEPGKMADAATAGEAAHRVGRLFPEVYRRYHYAQQLHSADLPVTRRAVEALQHLAAGGPLTVGEQAEHLGLRRNSVSELLTRLEAKGLVARVRDERDERRVLVWLTDAGRDVVSRVGQVLAPDLLATAMAAMTPAERATVIRGFELLAAASTPATRATPNKAAASPRRPSRAPLDKKGTSR